jgi:hypothetical protein
MRDSEPAGRRMRCFLLSAVLLGGLMPVGLAQGAVSSDAGLTLATVKLSAAIRSGIERVVFGNLSLTGTERHAEAARTPIERLEVGPRNRWVWLVTAPNDQCGSHAKCTMWLFDPVAGASLVDDDVLGVGLDVLDTRHHGWRDLETSGNISYCESVSVIYQFDGRRYHSVRTTEDKSSCDQ